jgi:cbb3-type cytochrome oxidase subunit 1
MTKAKYLPQIDSIYAYNMTRETPFTHRHQDTEDYEYVDRHSILRTDKNGIEIYHQSAEVNGVSKGLTMVTLDSDEKRVKEFFDNAIKELETDPSKASIFYTARKPIQVNILHIY